MQELFFKLRQLLIISDIMHIMPSQPYIHWVSMLQRFSWCPKWLLCSNNKVDLDCYEWYQKLQCDHHQFNYLEMPYWLHYLSQCNFLHVM